MLPLQIALGDFALLFAGLASVVAVLHLLHRRYPQRVVSSLRFWQDETTPRQTPRARLEQPWSLLLQILALALLMLALTDRPSDRAQTQRHILLLNTSASARNVFNAEKKQLRRFLKNVPPSDPLQLVAADGVAAPLTPFTTGHAEIEQALAHAQTSDTALDWRTVSAYTNAALHAGPEHPGHIAYFGPPATTSAAGVCEQSPHTVRVGIVSQRPALWNAILRTMPGFASANPQEADMLLYDRSPAPKADLRPALFIDPPANTRPQPRDAVLRFDPLASGARFDTRSAIALLHAMRQVAGPAAALQSIPAGEIDWPVPAGEDVSHLELLSEEGPLAFNVRENLLTTYVGRAGLVALKGADQTVTLCLTSPLPAAALSPMPRQIAAAATFRPWRLFATLAAVVLVLEWWLFSRHTRCLMLLKLGGVAAILLALYSPILHFGNRPTALLLVLDSSSSMGPAARQRAAEYAAHSPAAATIHFGNSSTGIESALMQALAHAPENFTPRIRLLSDGNENEGSALRAAAALRRSGVPVDSVPIGGGAGPVHIRSLTVPPTAFSGESFPVTVALDCSQAQPTELRLYAQGKQIGRGNFSCRSGGNTVELQARVRGAGAMTVSGIAGTSRFDQPVVIARPRALYISGDPAARDTNFVNALQSAGFTVTQTNLLPPDLTGADLLIANNIDMNSLSAADQTRLERFVDAGGGLLVLSGDQQIYHEHKTLATIDRVLPALVRPPQTPEGISVVLVIDKSSSMEGRKIQLARLSASAVVDHLRPVDTIGILIFDNAFSWVATPRTAVDKPAIKRLIAGIVPDGGTQIPTAVEEAYRRILLTRASYKHIVLLTDGISEEGDSLALAEEAAAHQVTISTIGLGQDVNRPYLEKLAQASGGQSYFLDDPSHLRDLLLKDIAKVEAKTSVESRVTIAPTENPALLKDVDLPHAPALHGYVRYDARPGARVLLHAAGEHPDPLLTDWFYGLGHVAVFSSDAKSRWASEWIGWPGFDTFWTDLAFGLSRREASGVLKASLDRGRAELLVDYSGTQPPERCYYFGPNGAHGVLHWEPAASGYRAKASVTWAPGLWVIRPERETNGLAETAVLARDSEAQNAGTNDRLLHYLSQITGGVYNPAPNDIPAPLRPQTRSISLWPALLWLAIALMLIELLVRKLNMRSASN